MIDEHLRVWFLALALKVTAVKNVSRDFCYNTRERSLPAS